MRQSLLLFVLSVAISGLAVGCADETADIPGEPSDSAEDALTASELPNVTAISFETTRRPLGGEPG